MKIFTSESVSEGHPDKVCDQISDAILDACLNKDVNSRVACEVFACHKKIVVSGEITCNAKINYSEIAKNVLKKIDYSQDPNIDVNKTCFEVNVRTQSLQIARGIKRAIDNKTTIGAGDQGNVFGYACLDTEDLMPLSITLAHELLKLASILRKNNEFKYALPDMKSQVTIEQNGSNNKFKIKHILLSIQHKKNTNLKKFEDFIKTNIITPIVNKYQLNHDFTLLINPVKNWVNGGWLFDTGLTGRKIIVDTYGSCSKHGGGAFSGKDGTKIDRSGTYYARYIAKNLVAAGFCKKCEIQISYSIGMSQPTNISLNTFNTTHSKLSDEKILSIIKKEFNFSPSHIIDKLNLTKIKYLPLAVYGHFGKNAREYPWEKLDKVKLLKKYL